MFHLCLGVRRSLLIAWLIFGHAPVALAESMIRLSSDHVDTVSSNLHLSLHEILQQVAAIHAQQTTASESATLTRKACRLGELGLTQLLSLQLATRSHSNLLWNITKYNQAAGVLS